jgi:hypothetical protein
MNPTNTNVLIHNGGGKSATTGSQSTHRIHVNDKGVEHIYLRKRWVPLSRVQNQVGRKRA